MLKTLREFCKKILILGCVGYTAQEYIATPWYLEETSMEPTLKAKQIVLSSSLFSSLSRGDIVIVKSPQNPKQRVCKRIIALPGDTISYNQNADLVIRNGHFWLEGDCKRTSVDSRHYGEVPIGLLEGKVILSLLPLKMLKQRPSNIETIENL